MRIALPVLLVVALMIEDLAALQHPLAGVVPEGVAVAVLAPLMVAVRGWISTIAVGIAFALAAWGAGLVVYLVLHPPA
jgi:hypothetical protein